MKKHLLLLLSVFSLSLNAANYFWVGGTGNWSDINHWATSSGGSSLHSFVPSQNDDVFFDANSGFSVPGRTVTVNSANSTCRNMVWSGIAAGNSPLITGLYYNNLDVYGSMTLQNGILYSVATTNFKSLVAGQTLTTNGVVITGNIYFNGTGGSWSFQDNLTVSSTIYLDNGVLNTNNVKVNAYSMDESGAAIATRTLNLGASEIYLSSAQASPAFKYTGNTVNAGTSLICLTGNYNGFALYNSFFGKTGHAYNRITYSNPLSTGVAFANQGSVNLIVRSLTFMGSAAIYGGNLIDSLTLSPGKKYMLEPSRTQTITAALTATSTGCNGLIEISTKNIGTQASIRFNAGATANVSGAIIKDVNVSGPIAPITANNSFDMGNNTNITFITPAVLNLYWVGGSGNWNDQNHWALSSGGIGGTCIPTPLNNVFFDAGSGFTAGNNTVNVNEVNQYCNDMTWNGAAASPIILGAASNYLNIHGSVTLQGTMTYSVLDTWLKTSLPTRSVTTNAALIQGDFNFCGSGGWILQDNFNSVKNIFFNLGNLNTNGYRVDVATFANNSTGYVTSVGSRTLSLGASPIYVSGVWIYNTGPAPILNSGTSHIYITSYLVPFGQAGFDSYPGLVYNDITFTNPASTNAMVGANRIGNGIRANTFTFMGSGTINRTNIFNNLVFSSAKKYIIDNVQQTILGSLTATTAACAGIGEILSFVPGSQATFSFAPTTTGINVNNTALKDIRAVGSFTPFTAFNSIDFGNNTNINFTTVAGTNLYWIGGTGNWTDGAHWSFTSGGPSAFCIPTPNDNVFFDGGSAFSASSNSVALNGTNHYCNDMTWVASITNNPIIAGLDNNPLSIFGSLTLQTLMRFNPSVVYFKSPVAGKTIRSNGNVMVGNLPGTTNSGFYFDGNGEWSLADDLNMNRTIYFGKGSIKTNNFTLSLDNLYDDRVFASVSPDNRSLNIGTSIINVKGYYWWFRGSTATLIAQPASTIIFTYGAGGQFQGQSGHVYGDLIYKSLGGTAFISAYTAGGTLKFKKLGMTCNGTISGNHIMDTLILSAGKVYQLEAATTQTVTSRLYASGNPCFITFLQSITPSSRANLRVQAGSVNYDYLNVRDINASTSYTVLNAAGHSTDAGNNVNWSFAPTTTVGISGLGPDITRCQSQLPLTLNTANFYPNPFTLFSWTGGSTADSLVVTTGGSYNVSVNYGASCVVNDNILVTANPNPTVSVSGATSLCSGAQTVLTASGASTYTWTGSGITTNTLQVTPSTSTTYSVVGTSTANCVGTQALVTVVVNPTPTVSIASVSSSAICNGGSSVITPGGASTYTLVNTGATGTSFTVSPSSTITYTLSGSSASNCLAGNTAQQVITVNPTPTVSIASVSSSNICNGSSSVITPGGASTYTLVNTGAAGTSFTVSPSSTTTYTLSGTSASNCAAGNTAQQVITVNPTPTVSIASVSSSTICNGGLSVITPGGASTYTLVNTGAAGTSFTVSPSVTTTYTIAGTSVSNCAAGNRVQQLIMVNPTPTVSIASVSSSTICNGGLSVITPGGASTYTLVNTGAAGTSFTVSPSTTTTYTISGSSASNCAAGNTIQQVITVNPTPTVSIASVSSSTICNGGLSVITPGGASTYTLVNTGAAGTSFTVSPSTTTTYTIAGTSVSNCAAGNRAQQVITVNPTPTVSIASVSSSTICNGGTAIITPAGASTYTLVNTGVAGTSFTVSPSATTTYTINGTSASNCASGSAAQQIITVNALPLITFSALTDVSCFGLANGSVSLTATGGSGSGYSITPAATANLAPGIYTYTLTDSHLCSRTTTISISQPTAAISSVVTGTTANTSCTTPDGMATVSVQGGTPTYTVSWDNGATGTTVSTLNTGTHTYTVTDVKGCTNTTGTLNLTGATGISTNLSLQSNVSCFGGTNGALTYTTSGGSAYTYTLASSSATLTNATGSFTNLSPVTYSLLVTENTSGCIDVDIVTISSATALSISSVNTGSILCNGGTGVATATVNGGTLPYTYLWSSNTSTVNTASYTAGTYSVTIRDANNCLSSVQTFTVSQPLALSVSSTSTPNFNCNTPNGTAVIVPAGGTGVITVTWTAGSSIHSYTNTGLPTGNAGFVLNDANGCQLNGQVTISGVAMPSVANAQTQSVTCHGQNNGSVSLTVTGGTPTYTYSWSNTAMNVNTQTNLPAGVYTATVTDAGNCGVVQVFTITEPSAIAVTTDYMNPACINEANGNAAILLSGGTAPYQVVWNNGQQGLVLNAIVAGTYVATVTDQNVCQVNYSLAITDKSCSDVSVPQLFTPNGDGKNDKFEILKIQEYPNNSLSIFNRWGSLVYKKDKYNNEFDGKANVSDSGGGGLLPTGTYYVVLELNDGKSKPYTGYIQLVY